MIKERNVTCSGVVSLEPNLRLGVFEGGPSKLLVGESDLCMEIHTRDAFPAVKDVPTYR